LQPLNLEAAIAAQKQAGLKRTLNAISNLMVGLIVLYTLETN